MEDRAGAAYSSTGSRQSLPRLSRVAALFVTGSSPLPPPLPDRWADLLLTIDRLLFHKPLSFSQSLLPRMFVQSRTVYMYCGYPRRHANRLCQINSFISQRCIFQDVESSRDRSGCDSVISVKSRRERIFKKYSIFSYFPKEWLCRERNSSARCSVFRGHWTCKFLEVSSVSNFQRNIFGLSSWE